MPGPIDTPVATSNSNKRVLADVTNEKENFVHTETDEVKKPKFERRLQNPASIVSLDGAQDDVIVISLDGNIGAGKSTLLEAVRLALPEVEVVVEPVAEWETLKTADGKSLLQHFYEDKKRWSYTFQNCAILTRLTAIQKAIRSTKKKIIITERSLLTDRFVFAEMLRDSGDLDDMEWALYSKWFDNFAVDLPIKGVVHVTTAVDTSAARIINRGREGEGGIPKEYLAALDRQHYKWLDNTTMPVLRLSTEIGQDAMLNVEKIRTFVTEIAVQAGLMTCQTPLSAAPPVMIKSAPSPFTMNSVAIETL